MTNSQTTNMNQIVSWASRAVSWVDQNAPEDTSNLGQLRRLRRRSRRLHDAAGKPTSVAVFGASQAGKSYLVSSLARPRDGRMLLRYGQREFDFLKEINPQGGTESTGVVTRFTTAPPVPMHVDGSQTPDRQATVPVRLLSAADIVRVLMNSFMLDFPESNLDTWPVEDPEKLRTDIHGLAKSGERVANGFSRDDAEELQEYCQLQFSKKPYAEPLAKGYWVWLAENIEFLPFPSLIEALSPLWGRIDPFTKMAERFLTSLAQIGHASLAFCTPEAFSSAENGRDDSIVNVSTLFRMGSPQSDADLIDIVTESGLKTQLPRTIVTALIAELIAPIVTVPWPFLNTTDLLDFPGARTRGGMVTIQNFIAHPPAHMGEFFLRGKVAYLFDRYQVNMEISAMLLCVGDSNQNVKEVPRLVDRWVHETVGANPQQRMNQQEALFLVLTKFDTQLSIKEGLGEDDLQGVWNARLLASVKQFFKGAEWLNEWRPDTPFNNTLWLRSTSVSCGDIFEYRVDDEKRRHEVDILPSARDWIGSLEAAYLACPDVRTYIAQPKAAWDAVMTVGDGGISFLAARLEPLCDPAFKRQQIAGRIKEVARQILGILKPYFRDGDIAAEKKRVSTELTPLLAALTTMIKEGHHFGLMLRNLGMPRERVIQEWGIMQRQMDSEPEPEAETEDEAEEDLSVIGDLSMFLGDMGDLGLDVPVPDKPVNATRPKTRHDRFARRSVEAWYGVLDEFVADTTELKRCGLTTRSGGILVNYIKKVSRLLELEKNLADVLTKKAPPPNNILAIRGEVQSILVMEQIGQFITYLGYDSVPPDDRPRVPQPGGAERPIFASRAVPGPDGPTLPEKPSTQVPLIVADWLRAFLTRVMTEVTNGKDFDVKANEAVGEIIEYYKGIGA